MGSYLMKHVLAIAERNYDNKQKPANSNCNIRQ